MIFDCDGVLVDSEPLGYRVVNEMLAPYAITMDWEDYVSIIGTTVSPWDVLFGKHALPGTRQDFSDRFWGELERRVAAGQLAAKPGVHSAIEQVRRQGLPLGLASSSRRSYVAGVLSSIGVIAAFGAIVCREDVVTGKPDPAPYLETASRLGVEPAGCLAVEDSPAGLASARAAGMRALAVRTVYTREADLREADFILPSLEAFSLADLLIH
jgi:HAD superfamily hydrolase (TIGR01509 family)